MSPLLHEDDLPVVVGLAAAARLAVALASRAMVPSDLPLQDVAVLASLLDADGGGDHIVGLPVDLGVPEVVEVFTSSVAVGHAALSAATVVVEPMGHLANVDIDRGPLILVAVLAGVPSIVLGVVD